MAPLPFLSILLSPAVVAVQKILQPAVLLAIASSLAMLALVGLKYADLGGDYLTQVLPVLAILSGAMALSAAPLTAAVLDTVSPAKAGLASGFNSAVARIGGGLATASMGPVFGGAPGYLGETLGRTLAGGVALSAVAALAAIWLAVHAARRAVTLPFPTLSTQQD